MAPTAPPFPAVTTVDTMRFIVPIAILVRLLARQAAREYLANSTGKH